MIDLFAAGTSNGMRARIALEECGLAYKLHPIALEKAENKTPQFMALNPNAQIPVIVDHEGPGGKPYNVFESGAILMYLAEKTGKFMSKDMRKKYDRVGADFRRVPDDFDQRVYAGGRAGGQGRVRHPPGGGGGPQPTPLGPQDRFRGTFCRHEYVWRIRSLQGRVRALRHHPPEDRRDRPRGGRACLGGAGLKEEQK